MTAWAIVSPPSSQPASSPQEKFWSVKYRSVNTVATASGRAPARDARVPRISRTAKVTMTASAMNHAR